MAFIRAVGNVIRPFQLGKINVLTWNVLNGRIRRFAECQGVAGIGNHTARDGHDNATGIALDGNRMIWTWKLDLPLFHVSVSFSADTRPLRNCMTCSTNSSGYWYCALEAAPELGRDHPSIHRDGGTSHVRRISRRDKGDHMRDLLRCCQA